MPLNFEWDKNEANSNVAKHGITFEEASTVFGDPLSMTIPDPDIRRWKDRFTILGNSHRNRLLVVVQTDRDDNPHHQRSASQPKRTQKL